MSQLLTKILNTYADRLDELKQRARDGHKAFDFSETKVAEGIQTLERACTEIRNLLDLERNTKNLELRNSAQASKIETLEKRIEDLTSCLKELNVSVQVKGCGISVKRAGPITASPRGPSVHTSDRTSRAAAR